MKFASILSVIVCAVAAPCAIAQDSAEQCSLNDAACLEAQVVRQCRDRTVATIRSCTDWIQSVRSRAREDDRVAKTFLAAAHVSIALLLPVEDSDRSQHRRLARDIYAELLEKDGADLEALLGLSSAAESESERIETLRMVASLSPRSLGARLLAMALLQRGGERDILEAAEAYEAFYRLSPKGSNWDVAANAARLYDLAGASDRNQYFRDRLREEIDSASLLLELQRIPQTDSARAAQNLALLCDKDLVTVIGAATCFDGLEQMSRALAELPESADDLEFAEAVARQIWAMGTSSGWDAVTGDPLWRGLISRIFRDMEAEGIESPVILAGRAMLSEEDRVQKLRLLDQATQLSDPDDSATLKALADLYLGASSRPTEALALYRRVRDLLPNTDPQRGAIDRTIEVLERAEQNLQGSESIR